MCEGCTTTKGIEQHVACLQCLIVSGAQINFEKKGKTILMLAAMKGYIELIEAIIEHGAWINHEDSDSKTALHYAIDNKVENLDCVNFLIEKGADMNKETTSDGFTPLIFAVNRGHIFITRILVEKGAKFESAEINNNNTALHLACQFGHKDIVEILANETSFHSVFHLKNKNGQLAKDVAEEKVMDF